MAHAELLENLKNNQLSAAHFGLTGLLVAQVWLAVKVLPLTSPKAARR